MKMYRKWGRRILAAVLAALIVVDSETIVLAEEVRDLVSEAYSEYEQEKQYEEERDTIAEQVVPELEEGTLDEGTSDEGDTEGNGEASGEEVPDSVVSLRLPDTRIFADEKEAELESLYGEPVEVSGHEKVYQVDALHYITYLTSEANTYIAEDGEEREIDLTLVPTEADTGRQCGVPTEEQIRDDALDIDYVTRDCENRVALPANATSEKGIRIQNGEHTLELFPEDGNYGNATIQEQALLYNQVQEQIDVQYTAQSTGLKEDIILNEWTGIHEFGYSFCKSGYEVEESDNRILIREEGKEELLYVLSAPVMTDAAGAESRQLTLSLREEQDTCYVTLDADRQWLADEGRVYPVQIDPTVTIPTSSLIEVTTSTVHGTYQGEGYGYAGYITSQMTGVPGAADIGRSRMYFAINYNFRGNIPDEAKIDRATLNVYQYIQYPQTTATFACYRLKSSWDPGSLTWDNSVRIPQEPAGANSVSGGKHGMHQFDIRESVNNWVQGISPNYGLVVMATNETDYGGAFYTPYSTGTGGQTDFTWDKRPSITIQWSVPDPVDMDYGIDDTTVALRSMILTSKDGKLQFQGVFADGVAAPGSTVAYALNDTSKNYNGAVYASYSYKYPDTSGFQSAFPEGTTKYKDKLGNWQTIYPFTEPAFNVRYSLNAAAVKNGIVGKTSKSDDFTIYKVTQFDTLPKIASYYGIPLAQIMHDNRVQDMLLVENNTLFIRNPQKNAETPYNPPALTDEDKAGIDAALMGRGLHCEFGFEPVNLNTGNFYLNRTDVSIPDYTGDFAIERNYNSKGAALNGVFGRGWSAAYSEQLSQMENGDLNYRREDGSILRFAKKKGVYQAPEGYDLTLERRQVKENKYDFGNGEETYPVYEYRITDADQTVKIFDCFGMLTGIEDEKGNQIRIIYDANKNLKQIRSASGSIYQVNTDEEGRIIEIGLPNGAALRYGYDENGDLISFTDACGAVIRYEYDSAHRMTAWYDGNGACVVRNKYDKQGRVICQTDACGGVSTLKYASGKTTAVDGNGNVTTYYYDENYRTVKVENPDGTVRAMSYDGDNRLASETDELGNVTSYAYDANGNLTTETRFDGKSIARTYDKKNHLLNETGYDGIVTEYTYDTKGNLESVSRGGRLQASYTTDSKGRMVKSRDANGNTTSYAYDKANLTGILEPEGGWTAISYNAHGQITAVTNPVGGVTKYSYDAEGRKTKETTPDGVMTSYCYDNAGSVTAITDGNGYTVSFTYDAMGRRIGTDNGTGGHYSYTYDSLGNQTAMTDAEGHITDYTYDWRGNVLSETDAAGNKISYTYDALGNQTGETAPSGAELTSAYDYAWNQTASVTDAAGETVSYTFQENGLPEEIKYPSGTSETYQYDQLGRIIRHTDEAGLTTAYTYDDAGNILSEDAEGQVTSYEYDKNNRVILLTRPDGAEIHYAYDAAGNVTEVTDAEGHVTAYSYTKGGSLASVTDPLGRKTVLGYDRNGNITKVVDAAGNTSRAEYGALSLKSSETDALGNVTAYGYNQMEQVTSVTDAAGGVTSYTYDPSGRLEAVRDANGNAYTFSYDSNGNYSRITAPDGTETVYEYNELDQVVKESASSGLVTEYEYDAKGQLTHIWDNEGMEAAYTYNGAGNVLAETNALGETTEYTYDKYQRVTRMKEASGAETSYAYDASGNLTAMTAPDGAVTSYTYDKNGNLLSQETGGRIWSYEYDAAGQLIKETDAEGGVTEASYDLLGNLAAVTDAEGRTKKYGYNALSLPVFMQDAEGGETLLAYDALKRLVKVTTAEGGSETYTYDGTGNQTGYTDGEGNTRTAAYDSMNRLVKEILPNGGENSYTYDMGGSLLSETDALGNITAYENNLHGQPVKRTLPNGAEYTYAYDRLGRLTKQTASQGLSQSYTYDSAGNLVKETDQSGRETAYEYDVMGQLTSVTDALGQKTAYRYDDAGNLTETRSPMGYTASYSYDRLGRLIQQKDAGGRTETYAYDKTGNLVSSMVNGAHETLYDYDSNGNLTRETNALGISTRYSYDAMNRLAGVIDGNGDKTSYAYDHNSQLTAITDPLGGVTAFAYDGEGNLTGFTDGEGRSAAYTYDLAGHLINARTGAEGTGEEKAAAYTYDSIGNVTSSTDGNGNETTYTYDLLGNLTEKTNGLGEKEQYAYDENNRLSQITRAGGKSIRYDYNKLDELLKKEYSEEADGQVLYTYDLEGRRVSMEDLTGTSLYEYDENGRITGVQQGDGSVIRYTYDSFGNLSALTYPDGSAVSYEYDALDRLVQVTDREGKKTAYTYDKAGNLTKISRANGTSAEVSYDGAGQVTEIRNLNKKGKLQSSYRYGYDLSGSIRTEEISTADGKGHEFTVIQTYAYDSAGQLVEAEKKAEDGTLLETTVYGYDGAGNRIQTATNLHTIQKAVTEVNQYNGANRLVSSRRSESAGSTGYINSMGTGDGACSTEDTDGLGVGEDPDKEGLTEYLYDQNGNRIRELKNGEEIKSYAYDTENRLIAVRDRKGLLMAALYDGDSNRVFTAGRTEDTNAYQLFAKKKPSPKTSTQGEEGSIFWYGFGQNFIQALHVAKETLGRVWKDTWEELVSAYHRKIAKDRADEEGLVVNPDGITGMPGDGEATYPSETGQALIPYQVAEETYDYYEVRNYVNDINQDYTQVLTGYDEKGRIRESYTYGITENSGSDESGSVTGSGAAIGGRLDYSDGKDTWYYGYTGTGSVAQLTDKKGALAAAYSYDAFGNTSVQDHIGNITGNRNITENYTLNPYTYNAEYTDASTGNQYLRARYYSPETGNFFTEDSYLGSLLEPLERNLYTYAENDPVNYSDPSGHGVLSKAWNKVKSISTGISNSIRKGASQLLGSGRSIRNIFSSSASKVASSLQARIFKGASIGAILGTRNSRISTAYQRAKASGQSTYRWEGSRAKEAKNIQLSWTKALENTMKHFCTTAKKLEKQIGLARLEAKKNVIKVSGNQTIAVTGTMSFGAVVDSLISSGIAAETAEGLASKLISLAGGAFGSFAGVLGGTALLWWFSPIEAGESEEQATAWMAKGENSVDSETGREYKKKKQVKGKQKDDIPERFKGEKPYKGESGKEAAKRVLEKYGEYDPKKTGPGSDFNKLKKYFDTHFE